MNIKAFNLQQFTMFSDDVRIDPNKLPDCVKQRAKLYCEQQPYSYADNAEQLYESLTAAWLAGFAFCLQGKVTVEVNKKEEQFTADWVVRSKEPL